MATIVDTRPVVVATVRTGCVQSRGSRVRKPYTIYSIEKTRRKNTIYPCGKNMRSMQEYKVLAQDIKAGRSQLKTANRLSQDIMRSMQDNNKPESQEV